MALQAGVLNVTVEFAANLKDKEWFGKQDPYAVIQIGSQKYRTKTHTDGGKNPVWNQTFSFQIINENDLSITVLDEEVVSTDDVIGRANVSLAGARSRLTDRQQVPLYTKSGKQHGTVSLSFTFQPNAAPPGAAAPYPSAPPAPYGAPPPQAYPAAHGAPPGYPPAPTGYPPAGYPPAPAGYPPQPAHGAPAGYPPAPAGYPGGYPPPAVPMPAGYPAPHGAPSGYPAPHGAPYGAAPYMVHGGAAVHYGGYLGWFDLGWLDLGWFDLATLGAL